MYNRLRVLGHSIFNSGNKVSKVEFTIIVRILSLSLSRLSLWYVSLFRSFTGTGDGGWGRQWGWGLGVVLYLRRVLDF